MNRLTQQCHSLATAPWFSRVSLLAIVFAGVLVGLETSPALMAAHGALFHSLDRLVLAVFIVELLVGFGASGARPLNFLRDGWNAFDLAVVLLCLLPAAGPFAAALRLARLARLLRLVTALPKLQLLVGALFKSLSAMGYVTLLLGLMFYIYAIAGVQFFAAHDARHFGNLGDAFVTLFRIVTLDNWGDLYETVAARVPLTATAYFVSFILLGTMIMMNLFIGIIMNSMAETHAEQIARVQEAAREVTAADGLAAKLDTTARQLTELQTALAILREELSRQDQSPGSEPPAWQAKETQPVRALTPALAQGVAK